MIKHTYFNPSKMWDELSFIKLRLGRVGMGRVLHLGPSWHGPIFKWAELAWAELVLGRVVLHPFLSHSEDPNETLVSTVCLDRNNLRGQKNI